MNAKPFDSWVSGLRITLTASATRFSEESHDLISSAVTQTGRFPRKTVKLMYKVFFAPREVYEASPRWNCASRRLLAY